MVNGIDFLINNAGVSCKKHFLDQTIEDIGYFNNINFKSTLLLTQPIAIKMVANKVAGSIYTVTSIDGIQPGVGLSVYGATKGALETLMKGIALELAPHNILVNTEVVSAIETDMRMPSLLPEKFHLSVTAVGSNSLLYHHAGAFIGVITGGATSDKWSKKVPHNQLLVQAIALLAGATFIYLMGQGANVTTTYAALFLFGICRGIYDSSIFASLYEVVAPQIKSSASGLMLMCAFLIGAFSLLILGALKPTLGLSSGLSSLWMVYVLDAVFILAAVVFFFKKDQVAAASVSEII